MNAVLIIDDDWAIRESLTDILCVVQPHLRVLCAPNGQKGIEMAAAERPDLILLDGQMPDMNGAQVAGLLRQSPLTSKIPLVAMTGFDASNEAATDLYRLCDAWLTKPFSLDCLLNLIRHIFEPTEANNHTQTNPTKSKRFTPHPFAVRTRTAATIS
jgi:DNA-binding response OmpR family regulator